MPDALSLSKFIHLANRLGAGLRIKGEAGDKFYNPVKIVKFIRK